MASFAITGLYSFDRITATGELTGIRFTPIFAPDGAMYRGQRQHTILFLKHNAG